MDEAIVIISLIGFALFCFYLWAYNSGVKSVKSSLPSKEAALKKREADFENEKNAHITTVKEFEQFQSEAKRNIADIEAELRRRDRQLLQQAQDLDANEQYLKSWEQRLIYRELHIQKEVDKAIADEGKALKQRENKIAANEQALLKRIAYFDKSREEVLKSSVWLASIYADIDAQKAVQESNALIHKSRPAFTAAAKVKEFGQLRRQAVISAKAAQYQVDYLFSIFPWLEDYLEMRPEDAAQLLTEAPAPDDEYSAVREWLSPDEYESLSDAEKWQLALDRYNKRQKSKWKIGIEYERYIGYLLEQKGYTVHYNGATEGVEDMGRDLIAENSTNYLIVQCKRWAQEKVIHEKHIFQLYGTTVLQKLHQKTPKNIIGVFVTTADVSPLALDCADYLDIQVYTQIPYMDYPKIKCNYSNTGEKIYHLPFDQQYDRTLIIPNSRDFYAKTVQEAESKGFRHAFHWHGE